MNATTTIARPAESAETSQIEVLRVEAHLGVEVRGLDLTGPIRKRVDATRLFDNRYDQQAITALSKP